MTDAELRRALRRIHPPDELGAERRAWMLVRAAFDEREPATRRPQVIRPLLVLAGALALIAAVVNPPVLNAIRDAVGRTTEKKVVTYKQALFSLPAQGRLLVNTARGPWIIQPGGARRLLGRYRDASWSPRGLFVAAVGRHDARCPAAERNRPLVAGPLRPPLVPALVARERRLDVDRVPARHDPPPRRRRQHRGHPAGRSGCGDAAGVEARHELRPLLRHGCWTDPRVRRRDAEDPVALAPAAEGDRARVVGRRHAAPRSHAPLADRVRRARAADRPRLLPGGRGRSGIRARQSPDRRSPALPPAERGAAARRRRAGRRRPARCSTPTAGSPRSRGRRTAAGCSPAGRAPTRSCS